MESSQVVMTEQTYLPTSSETVDKSPVKGQKSKVQPVCGICGKKFVCVTTMKRHLVIHTGEKPYECNLCGKQYTQKGNLRVHERTHRNDRPFECNICHQKFYRKEPMQKHQWRQHGIVHIKKGLPETSTLEISNQTEIRPIVSYAPPISSTRTEEQFSYSHILKDNPSETPIKLRMKMEYQKLNHVEHNQEIDQVIQKPVDILPQPILDQIVEQNQEVLQCIGCLTVFPHKSELKSHQLVDDNQRPFKCCQCGYKFRQKAHLQKHQWRIHRRCNIVDDPQPLDLSPAKTYVKNWLMEKIPSNKNTRTV